MGIIISIIVLIVCIFIGIDTAKSISEGRYLEKDENGLYKMKYEEYADSPFEKEMISLAEETILGTKPSLNQIYDDVSKGILHVYKIKGEVKIVRGTPEAIYIEGIQTDEGSDHKSFQAFLSNSF
ncbi:hypothetical protein AZF37_08710 [endosymbiont 'TC1' of Trimyema compressum]|uniref:hypothetical protein n=1 Tax=endosymbiont 'TC1' of Trimyema compressum TaxID=243899 RepID=UPI0007F0C526|nr:hypothetical protein [endosymbiont 'TC1' of Trimyema compressum]AMP21220.1 hypothetical protein AZF37_08710 [endosymbiont 'TC1' of Trimyema compressum]